MIRLAGVSKTFGDATEGPWIFRGVDLAVAAGESVVIVGPSGGGKSLLLKIIARLLDCEEGTVEVATQNVGMLFQKNALFDSFTVLENLLFPLRERRGIRGQEALNLATQFLKAVGLSGNEELFPDEISGGMQKRLGIARALIVEPELILYDEPTAGLDPITSRSIAELILELRKSTRSTLVTVTNDVQRAYQIADRILLMAGGTLVDGGPPAAVRATRDPALRQFLNGLQEGPLTADI